MKQNDEILEKSPDAEKIFRVPDGYFESFAKQLEEKTACICNERNEAGLFLKWWKPLSVAASVAVAIVCTSLYFNERQEDKEQLSIEHQVLYSQLEDLEIIDFLASEED